MRNDQLLSVLRFLLWGGAVFLVVLRYFDVNPIIVESAEPELVPEEAPTRAAGEVVVVVDSRAVAQSAATRSFKQTDWSYAWLNTMEQEFGPCTLMEAGQLISADLSNHRFVIVTASAASRGSNELSTALLAFVQSGGVLVLERPGGALRETYAADGRGGIRRPKLISNVKDLSSPFDAHLKSMPLNTSYIGSSGPVEGAETWLAMDGVPVIYSRRQGRGTVVVVEFNYGLQLTSLQQGRPRDNLSVANRYPQLLGPTLESSDLVTNERLLNNTVPYADILEKYLVHKVMGHHRPAIGLWSIEGGRQGALLMTHDEEMMGDEATWMAQWEKAQGLRSTYFVTSGDGFTSAGAQALRAAGADLQMSWNPPWEGQGIFEPVGVWKINPLRRAMTLEDQKKALSKLTPSSSPIVANRNHDMLWTSTYAGVFRRLAAVGVSIDASYGPGDNARGYLFGTGLPFWALDETGIPLPVIEHPTLTTETLGEVDARFMHALFRDSQDAYHQAINVLFHPNAYQTMPRVALFDLWLATYDLARDHDHVVTTLTGFHRFWRDRRKATLRTRVRVARKDDETDKASVQDDDGRRDALLATEEGQATQSITIVAEVRVDSDGHHLSAPAYIRGRRLREARQGGVVAGSSASGRTVKWRATDVLDQRVALIPLQKGYNTLTLSYR